MPGPTEIRPQTTPNAAKFAANARDLPWRDPDPATGRRNPYFSLVSELMLQQTQVARVVEKFAPFIARFPTPAALAAATIDDVLAAWTGLGYYRRARLLHAAALAIVDRHNGEVPRTITELKALPGIGRYTAGAIASICFDQPEPIVDGNVSRVLLRIAGKELASDDPAAVAWVWEESGRLAAEAGRAGIAAAFNEGLMELGATVCPPAAPRCEACPVRRRSNAAATGRQDSIPLPKARAPKRRIVHSVVLIHDTGGRVLLERRPDRGLWAGLWQAPTLEGEQIHAAAELRAAFNLPPRADLTLANRFTFHATHREVVFRIWLAAGLDAAALEFLARGRRWCTRDQADDLGMPSPQRRIILAEDIGHGLLPAAGGDIVDRR